MYFVYDDDDDDDNNDFSILTFPSISLSLSLPTLSFNFFSSLTSVLTQREERRSHVVTSKYHFIRVLQYRRKQFFFYKALMPQRTF